MGFTNFKNIRGNTELSTTSHRNQNENRIIGKVIKLLQKALLNQILNRVTAVEDRLTAVEDRLTAVEDRLTALEGRVITLEGRVTAIEENEISSSSSSRDDSPNPTEEANSGQESQFELSPSLGRRS